MDFHFRISLSWGISNIFWSTQLLTRAKHLHYLNPEMSPSLNFSFYLSFTANSNLNFELDFIKYKHILDNISSKSLYTLVVTEVMYLWALCNSEQTFLIIRALRNTEIYVLKFLQFWAKGISPIVPICEKVEYLLL